MKGADTFNFYLLVLFLLWDRLSLCISLPASMRQKLIPATAKSVVFITYSRFMGDVKFMIRTVFAMIAFLRLMN